VIFLSKSKNSKIKNKKIWLFVKAFIITGIVGVALLISLLAFAVMGCLGGDFAFDADEFRLSFTSQLFYIDENGNPQEFGNLFYEQNRVWVDLEDIPLHMRQAAIAIEDERFERHIGFDTRRTVAAAANMVFRFDDQFGGSTITQQLIKNLTGDDATSPMRKIREISRAVNLERQLTKDEIIELYLNTIHLANGNNGVQAASRAYFGVDVGELTVAQSAAIISITQHPVRFCPFSNPENNRERQLLVLAKMLELGFLTEAEHQAAVEEEIVFLARDAARATGEHIHSYFVDQVIGDVLEALVNEAGFSETAAERMLFRGGLRIYTTFRPHVQAAIDAVYVPADSANFPRAGAQSAIVIIDPTNGHIVGLSGGVGEKTINRGLNRASQSVRQPGSATKAVSVFAPALEDGIITNGTVIQDQARTFGGWTVRNYGGSVGNRPVTVDEAFARSLNTVPVYILSQMGVDRSFEFMTENLRFSTLVNADRNLPALALGGVSYGLSVAEMAAAHVPFANGGIYFEPITFTLITDMDGNEILRRDEPVSHRAMTEATAYLTAQLLRSAVAGAGATGGQAAISGQWTAGKTGTTDQHRDRWFVGFTTHYVAAVWFGHDDPTPMPGIGNPTPRIFRAVMTPIHAGLPNRAVPRPAGVVSREVCTISGMIRTDLCEHDIADGGTFRSFPFAAARVPNLECDVHIEHFICYTSGMMATANCPPGGTLRVSRRADTDEEALFMQECSWHSIPTLDLDGTGVGEGSGQGTTSGTGTGDGAGQGSESGTGQGVGDGSGSGTGTDSGTGTEPPDWLTGTEPPAWLNSDNNNGVGIIVIE